MKFGDRLLDSQHPPWSENYIDYVRLKRLLHTLLEDVNHGNTTEEEKVNNVHGGSVTSAVSHYGSFTANKNTNPILPSSSSTQRTTTTYVTSSQSFEMELKFEIQKALLFLLKTLGGMSSDLSVLLKRQQDLSCRVHNFVRFSPSNTTTKLPLSEKTHLLQDIHNLRLDFVVIIGSTLLLLLEFVELNIEAIVKIVKKHDKFISLLEKNEKERIIGVIPTSKIWKKDGNQGNPNKFTRLRRQYLPRFAVYSSDPNVRCLFLAAADAGDCSGNKAGITTNSYNSVQKESGNFGGWDVMQWNLEVALRELFEWEQKLRGGGSSGDRMSIDRSTDDRNGSMSWRDNDNSTRHPKHPSAVGSFLTRSSTLVNLHSKNLLSSLKSGSSTVLSSLILSPPKSNRITDDNRSTFFEPMIYRIQSHRFRIGQMHDRYTRMVYAHEMIYLISDTKQIQREDDIFLLRGREDFGSVEKLEMIRRQSIGGNLDGKRWLEEGGCTAKVVTVSPFSKLLNLASASLYMCNYNIVAPTSGLYATMLGFDPACAGIIIGMTPMAVVVSCVLYSWWSSYSYKRAIIFASFCCIVGNLVYALALPCKSIKMVLFGRLLTGFGSARVINRRYIADYYSIDDRTSGMVDLVTASAVGSAVGPAIAASLSLIAPAHLSGTNTYWTIETAPGYVMFFLWSVLCICFVTCFEEPEREKPTNVVPASISKEIQLVNGSQTDDVDEENKPLFGKGATNLTPASCFEPDKILRSCGNIPVLISLMMLVLLKAVLEGLSSATPTVSRYYFGWGVHANGIFLAALASCVLPTNVFVARISRRFDDRELIIATLIAILCGVLGILNYGESSRYSEVRFVLFGLVIFVSCNALEGPTMGLLSKTIPKSLAKGIFNAGLLSTEAGTLGRVFGDIWFSSSTFMGLDQMLNRTFGPMSMMVCVCIGIVTWNFSSLQPTFEVDSEEDSEDGDDEGNGDSKR